MVDLTREEIPAPVAPESVHQPSPAPILSTLPPAEKEPTPPPPPNRKPKVPSYLNERIAYLKARVKAEDNPSAIRLLRTMDNINLKQQRSYCALFWPSNEAALGDLYEMAKLSPRFTEIYFFRQKWANEPPTGPEQTEEAKEKAEAEMEEEIKGLRESCKKKVKAMQDLETAGQIGNTIGNTKGRKSKKHRAAQEQGWKESCQELLMTKEQRLEISRKASEKALKEAAAQTKALEETKRKAAEKKAADKATAELKKQQEAEQRAILAMEAQKEKKRKAEEEQLSERPKKARKVDTPQPEPPCSPGPEPMDIDSEEEDDDESAAARLRPEPEQEEGDSSYRSEDLMEELFGFSATDTETVSTSSCPASEPEAEGSPYLSEEAVDDLFGGPMDLGETALEPSDPDPEVSSHSPKASPQTPEDDLAYLFEDPEEPPQVSPADNEPLCPSPPTPPQPSVEVPAIAEPTLEDLFNKHTNKIWRKRIAAKIAARDSAALLPPPPSPSPSPSRSPSSEPEPQSQPEPETMDIDAPEPQTEGVSMSEEEEEAWLNTLSDEERYAKMRIWSVERWNTYRSTRDAKWKAKPVMEKWEECRKRCAEILERFGVLSLTVVR